MEDMESIKKDIRWAKTLSIFEGVCFFVAGICTLMTLTMLGYISGGLLVILACMNIYPAFSGRDEYWVNMGMSLANDEDADEYGMRMEESRNENA